jgi:hypothetical protein
MRCLAGVLVACSVTFASLGARAADPIVSDQENASAERDIRQTIPNVAYAYTAHGARARTLGAQAYGVGLAASGQRGTLGGGVSVWGSPIDRVTLIGDGQRNLFGDFSPSAAIVGRLLGSNVGEDGWSLGALGKFKVDGFAGGPARDEVESEIESGLLLSYARASWHLDANAIAGVGTGDEGEVDTEGRLRFGRDVGSLLRLGVDGQARLRVAGPRTLPNGRTWDFAAGAQALLGSRLFFGALTVGPTTTGTLTDAVGWHCLMSIGGSTL